MHEGLNLCGHETVVDEKVFVDAELGVTTFQITSPVAARSVLRKSGAH
jgi:hypothetical protein